MRRLLPLVLLLAGCASHMEGKWPSLAPRAGEVAGASATTGACAGCGQDVTSPPPVPPRPVPPPPPALPADVETRLAQTTGIVAGIEARAPAQLRAANAAIVAARRDPARAGDAEVERSRFEALFLPLSIEDRRLDVLADDVAGHAGSDAVAERIAALRQRIAALQVLRVSLPD